MPDESPALRNVATPPEHSPASVALPAWARQIVEGLPVERLAGEIADRALKEAYPDHITDAAFRSAFEAGGRENLMSLREYLLGSLDLSAFTPSLPIALASIQAQLQIPESAVHHGYRIGAGAVLDHWGAEVGRLATAGRIDARQAMVVIELLTTELLRFQGWIVSRVAGRLADEQANQRASRLAIRRPIVQDLLLGECGLAHEDVTAALEYDIAGHHLALVLPDVSEPGAGALGSEASETLPVAAWLTFPLGAASTALWLVHRTSWDVAGVAELERLVRRRKRRASIGRPSLGVEGFVSTYHEARSTENVRQATTDSVDDVLAFSDVALEALALVDVVAARELVQDELRDLAADSPALEELRRTLRAWFEAGGHVSAAARLDVHEHTVRNRLRRIEQLVGHPLTVRRTELEVALRLHVLMSPKPQE